MLELPGAFNDWGIGTDEYNGSGVNWWVDVGAPIDGGFVGRPMVEVPHFFDDVDICIGVERRVVTVRPEKREICVRAA